MNGTASTEVETYILADARKPYLRITFGRNDTGTLTVEMTTPPSARNEPVRIVLNGATIADRNISARKSCDCPGSSESVVDGVHVRHREGCRHGEPRQYMWQYQGTLYTGNLADYARLWQTLDPEAQHAFLRTGDELRTWYPDSYRLRVTCDMDNDFSFHYRLSVGDEWIFVVIAGRA